MPELPDQKADRLIEEYGLPKSDVIILTKDKSVSDYFIACARLTEDRKRLSRWIIKELFTLLKKSSTTMERCPVGPTDFSRLVQLVSRGEITDKMGRTVLEEMFERGVSPDTVVEQKGLKPIHDLSALEEAVDAVLAENPDVVAKIKKGNKNPVDYLIGQVMKKTHGKAKPKDLGKLIEKKLLA
jgi:aspartyl-tRNA(Asn)/glutamyl-tRNA(Gln) amidotransferase subunit B